MFQQMIDSFIVRIIGTYIYKSERPRNSIICYEIWLYNYYGYIKVFFIDKKILHYYTQDAFIDYICIQVYSCSRHCIFTKSLEPYKILDIQQSTLTATFYTTTGSRTRQIPIILDIITTLYSVVWTASTMYSAFA